MPLKMLSFPVVMLVCQYSRAHMGTDKISARGQDFSLQGGGDYKK